MVMLLGKVFSVGRRFCYPVCHMCSYQCRLLVCEENKGDIVSMRCSRCRAVVNGRRARFRFAVTLQVVCENDDIARIVSVGERLEVVFGGSADEIMRTISQSHLPPDCVHAVLEEYFIGSWFYFSVQALQGNRANNRSYISHSIKPISTSAVEKCIIQLLADATDTHDAGSKVLCSQALPVTLYPFSNSSKLTLDDEESCILSTWNPSQPKTQLELESYYIGKDVLETKALVKTGSQCGKCEGRDIAMINWKLTSIESVMLDESLAHLLTGTLNISMESENVTIKQHDIDVDTLYIDKSHLSVKPISSKPAVLPESDVCGCCLSDVADVQHSWLVEFDDPGFCQQFFSTFHQEKSETKQPEEWHQDQQVESSISTLAINRQDRILTGCTAVSNSLPSGGSLQYSGTSGFGLWSVGQDPASCIDLKASYLHEHINDYSVDGEFMGSPQFISTPLHVAKKRCVQASPLAMKTRLNDYDYGSPLLFSESENDNSRTEVESKSDLNCGDSKRLVSLGYTPDLFSQ